MDAIIENLYTIFISIKSKITPNTYAIILSTLSFFISLYSVLSPRITKIRVSVHYNEEKHHHKKGYSHTSLCTVEIQNFSRETKYIQSVYMKYKYTTKSKRDGTFRVFDELSAIEPQGMIRIPIRPNRDTFLKGQNASTHVYAVAVDALGKEWISSNYITVAMLQKVMIRIHQEVR